MAVERTKYAMQWRIRYKGRLVDVLDRIRAIRMVLMVHIEQDLGKERELITVKILTPRPGLQTFQEVRDLCLGKIEDLQSVEMIETTLTKLL